MCIYTIAAPVSVCVLVRARACEGGGFAFSVSKDGVSEV